MKTRGTGFAPDGSSEEHSAEANSPFSSRWVVVLAGGTGERMKSFIQTRLKSERPKQYCALDGSRTMIQHALDLARRIAPPSQTISVVGPNQRGYYEDAVRDASAVLVIEQPLNRGNATAAFLALDYIFRQDPNATATILPSDQFVYPDELFVNYLRRMCKIVEAIPQELVLLGATAKSPETEYGWIAPALEHGGPEIGFPVEMIHEKPDSGGAGKYFRNGFFWNTMICSGNVRAWKSLGEKFLSETHQKLESHHRLLSDDDRPDRAWSVEKYASHTLFHELPFADFSSDFLQNASGSCRVVPALDLHWSDWGRPERVIASLRERGFQSEFDNLGEVESLNRMEPEALAVGGEE